MTNSVNASLHVSIRGLMLLMRFEGYAATEYRDMAGYRTIGFGHRLRGDEQYAVPISKEEAETLLHADVADAEKSIQSHVSVTLTQTQYDALVSLVYNIGSGAFVASTLLKMLNVGNYRGAGDAFLQWDKIHQGGVLVESAALMARRVAERMMFTENSA